MTPTTGDLGWFGDFLAAERRSSPDLLSADLHRTLLDDAGDPGVRYLWFPHASLMELLIWQDRLADAADVAEYAVSHFAGLGRHPDVREQLSPFVDALLGEGASNDDVNLARVGRIISIAGPDSVLGRHLSQAVDPRRGQPLSRSVFGYEGWEEAPRELEPPYRDWWQRIVRGDNLKPSEVRRLWTGAHANNAVDVARELYQRFGLDTPLWYVSAWFAGWQVHDGDVAGAQRTLVEARRQWEPFGVWNLMPTGPVMQPWLRPALTPACRAELWTLVGAPSWRSGGKQ